MKKKILVTCIFLIFFSLIFPTFQANKFVLADHTDSDEDHEIIKVGFYNWDGINIEDENMNRSGYAYEYLMHLARYNNWHYEFVGYENTWEDALVMLENGEIDLLCAMIKTEERSEKFNISELSMGTIQSILTTKKDNDKYYLNDKDFDYMKIGAIKENATNELFKRYADNHGINFDFVYSDSNNEHEELIKMLYEGKIDAIFRSQFDITSDEKIILNFGSKDIYIATNKDNTELYHSLNESMTRLNGNEPHLNDTLNQKYSKNHTHLNYTRAEIDYVEANKDNAIILGFVENNKPFSWIENDEYKGIFVELIDVISEKTGLPFKLMPIKDYELENLETVLNNDDLDGVIGFNSDINFADKLGLEISDKFMEYTYATLFYDFTDHKNIGIYKKFKFIDTPYTDYKDKQLIGNEIIHYYTSMDDGSDELEKKNITSLFLDEFSAQILMNQIYREDLNIKNNVNYKASRTIALRDTLPKEVIMLVNKGISNISDDELSEIYEKVIAYAEDDYNLYDFWTSYGMVSLIFSIMLAILVWTNKYHRKVLYDKNLELISTNNQKNSFMARMSHDMRTPLTAIIGLSDLRLSESIDKEDIEFYSQIKNSGLYLLDLVNDVLDLQKVDSGDIEFNYTVNDMRELVSHISKISNQKALEKDILFTLKYSDDFMQYAIFDQVRVKQILLNIVNNAVKYTPSGGSVSWDVSIKKYDDDIFFSNIISDTGIGMSDEFQDIMYNVFAREQSKLSKVEGGAGLGLAISKNLVDLMGGYINCKSKLNYGTVFKIDIPILLPTLEEIKSFEANEVLNDNNKIKDSYILICEDIEINAKIIEKILSKYDMKVAHAENGKIGVSMAKENNFDAIIMDIKMPVMDGLTAAKEIRLFDKNIPIIALSANAYAEDIKKSIDAGMNAHLSKPINNEKLISTLINLIDK